MINEIGLAGWIALGVWLLSSTAVYCWLCEKATEGSEPLWKEVDFIGAGIELFLPYVFIAAGGAVLIAKVMT